MHTLRVVRFDDSEGSKRELGDLQSPVRNCKPMLGGSSDHQIEATY